MRKRGRREEEEEEESQTDVEGSAGPISARANRAREKSRNVRTVVRESVQGERGRDGGHGG